MTKYTFARLVTAAIITVITTCILSIILLFSIKFELEKLNKNYEKEIQINEEIEQLYIIDMMSDNDNHSYYVYAHKMSEKYAVPYEILINLIYYESLFNKNAVNYNKNGTKDIGISQINSGYLEYFQNKYNMTINPLDEWQSIEFAARHLRYLLDRFQDVTLAVSAYNCGETAVKAGKIPERTKAYAKNIIGE